MEERVRFHFGEGKKVPSEHGVDVASMAGPQPTLACEVFGSLSFCFLIDPHDPPPHPSQLISCSSFSTVTTAKLIESLEPLLFVFLFSKSPRDLFSCWAEGSRRR